MRKSGLPPIARDDARLLILGSMPGDASLAAREYYAHPRNHFWRLLSSIIGRDLVAMTYAERVAALQSANIALWDVVGDAQRPGSRDTQIRDARVNDLRAFATGLPKLQAIAFNGRKSAALAARVFAGAAWPLLYLPSSSAANTLDFEAKRATWAELKTYLVIGKDGGDAPNVGNRSSTETASGML